MPTNAETLTTTKLRAVLLPIAASLPFLLSLVFHAIGPVASEAAKGADRPALAFEQYSINFGDRPVEPRRFVFARFGFENNSDRPATIRQLQPSCGCLNPYLDEQVYRPGDERTYQPGQKGEFFVRVLTANEQPGPKEYFVKLMYEDPKPREVVLSFRVVLPEQKVVIRPKALIFYQLGTAPTTQQITVTDYRTPPLHVTGLKSSSKLVIAEIGAINRDVEGNGQLQVSVTVAGQVPPGRHRALLTLFTDDPVYGELKVPLLIQGPGSTRHVLRDTEPTPPQRR